MLKFQQFIRTLNYIRSLPATQSVLAPAASYCLYSTFSNYQELNCNYNRRTEFIDQNKDEDVTEEGDDQDFYTDYQQRIKEKYPGYKHILYSSVLESGYIYNNDKPLNYDEFNKKDEILSPNGQEKPEIFNRSNQIPKRGKYKTLLLSKRRIPSNWFDDYEYYDESLRAESLRGENTGVKDLQDDERYKDDSVELLGNLNISDINKLGRADASIPSSNVPCNGCGAHLHCNHHKKPGFIPLEIFKGRTIRELKTIICQRCHFLKSYNIALELEVTPEFYVNTIKRIEDERALVILMVDLLDFPNSIWPGIKEVLGNRRPIFVVGNKVDLLPRDCNSYLDHVKYCLHESIRKCGLDKEHLNIKYINLISAKTGYGIEELINALHKHWSYRGNVYLMGCTNVGKSSLFNILLNSDYCRPETVGLIRQATTCPWPGTTLQMLRFPIYRPSLKRISERTQRLISESSLKANEMKIREIRAKKYGKIEDATPQGRVGQTFRPPSRVEVIDPFSVNPYSFQPIVTLDETSKCYKDARWVYDTPGIMYRDQITDLLTVKELEFIQPKSMIEVRAYSMEVGMSLFVAGLARLDFLHTDRQMSNVRLKVFLYAANSLPTMIVGTINADEIYRQYINTELMQIPYSAGSGNNNQDIDNNRLERWPGLQPHPTDIRIVGEIVKDKRRTITSCADITLSSIGWVGLKIPQGIEATFRVWTPQARGVHVRQPALVPQAHRLIGKKIRKSLAYYTAKPFVFRK